jgi:hypothetical protein
MDGNPELTKRRTIGRGWFFLTTAVLVVSIGVAVLRLLLPGLSQIREADLDAAEAKWKSNEVLNYDLAVSLGGRQTGEIRTQVRGGRAIGMTRNGLAMKEERTWQPWTVPGLFDTLRTDFDNAAHPAEKFGSVDVQVVLRAEFDPRYGFPRRYLQQVYGRLDDLNWTVLEFTPMSENK